MTDPMKDLLTNTFTMYAHAHIAHWNVRGPDFIENHKFLNDLYDDLWGAVDSVAEHIRASGQMAPTTLGALVSGADIEDRDLGSSWSSIAANLYLENMTLINSLNEAFRVAAEEEDQGLMNFLADRLDRHAKWGWMLRASQ